MLLQGGRAQLPQRVLAPAGDGFRVCDYKLEHESLSACEARFRDMFGLVVDSQLFFVPEQRQSSGRASSQGGGGGGGGGGKTGGIGGLLAALFGVLALLLAVMFAMN